MAQYKIVRPDTTVKDIKEQAGDQLAFPVVDRNGQYIGIIRSPDLYGESDTTTAQTILNDIESKEHNKYARFIFVNESEPLDKGLKLMSDKGLPFMPVVDNNLFYKGTIDGGAARLLR